MTREPFQSQWIQQLGSWGLSRRLSALIVAFALVFGLLAPLAWLRYGLSGMLTLGTASLICLVSGILALIVTSTVAPPQQAAAHVASGMLLRMGVPLAACLLVSKSYPAWAEAGFVWFLLAGFFLNLTVETFFSIGQLQQPPSAPPAG